MYTIKNNTFGVIVSVIESDLEKFKQVINRAQLAHTTEIRLDPICHRMHDFSETIIETRTEKPTILTLRAHNEGGQKVISLHEQLDFWNSLPIALLDLLTHRDLPVVADFGIDLVNFILKENRKLSIPWEKIGVSRHEMRHTPIAASEYLQELEQTPAQDYQVCDNVSEKS